MNENSDILTITELSIYLKIPRSTLYKLAREGKVPCQKIGRHWRFHRDAIDKWLKYDGLEGGAGTEHVITSISAEN